MKGDIPESTACMRRSSKQISKNHIQQNFLQNPRLIILLRRVSIPSVITNERRKKHLILDLLKQLVSQSPVKISKKSPSITGHFLIKPTQENQSKRKMYSHHDYSSSEFITDEYGRVVVYTDGACINNGRNGAQAGIGVYFNDNHPENVSRRVVGRETSNSAEIEAVTEAAKIVRRYGIRKIRIITDSEFLIDCITKWMPKWKCTGWKTASNHPVINKEELIQADRALAPLDYVFKHVNGHSGVHGNEMADKLAREGTKQYS